MHTLELLPVVDLVRGMFVLCECVLILLLEGLVSGAVCKKEFICICIYRSAAQFFVLFLSFS